MEADARSPLEANLDRAEDVAPAEVLSLSAKLRCSSEFKADIPQLHPEAAR